ncbi:MAG: class II aldolase/adducin family protein, partial [Bacteroidota bacterium]
MKQFKSLKKECLKANQQLPALGLVLFTFGNVSVADHKQRVFAIKPSGVQYPELTSESMVIVDFDGHILDGKLRPSSDTKTHAFLYKNWSKIGSIVHTHSTFATAWAQA